MAVGQEATGVIAIGQQATGVIAIGQLATGVIAVGQLARGVIVIGQLAVGVVSFGQLAVGLGWVGGMLGAGAVRGPGLLVGGFYGRLGLGDLRRGRLNRVAWRERHEMTRPWRLLAMIVIAAVVVHVAVRPVVHELTRVGGILRDPPAALR